MRIPYGQSVHGKEEIKSVLSVLKKFVDQGKIRQIGLSNILIILGSKIFDNIVLKTEGESWVIADTFSNAIKKIQPLEVTPKLGSAPCSPTLLK